MATCKYMYMYVRKTNTIRKATRQGQSREINMTALLSYWKDATKADSSLLSSAVEHGIRVLGYECIKPKQLTAIQSLLSGANVFMSVPTGFGKSLGFQVLPFCAECLLRSGRSESMKPVMVVVSPLLSLMHDYTT